MSERFIKVLIDFVKDHFETESFIPLHAPVFGDDEKTYVSNTIDSTFVSSVGEYVNQFEQDIADFTGSEGAVATVNGTAALHVCLKLAGVEAGDLVITQALTFVATCNSIKYCNADPVFIDVEKRTLGMDPCALESWLRTHAFRDSVGNCIERTTGRKISVCLPMHTFGHPADIQGLMSVCQNWNLKLVEDSAESLGSFYHGRHTGTFGEYGVLSFNGNKIITTGGGGMILCGFDNAKRAKHLTTTAKIQHPFEFVHDEIGFNYRLPNINAALGVAQLKQLPNFLKNKRVLAHCYKDLFENSEFEFVDEPKGCSSNFWLNAVLCPNRKLRDIFLSLTNKSNVMTRPAWQLMCDLPMFRNCMKGPLDITRDIASRLVNLPSSVKPNKI